ncbi:hypothetical protein CATMQ487_21070 [Sphaerotilus microaerophilus]|uniref:Uncharacterized protein n=1 Tax=Sphaerotilus microaerophilus TaxID=2914710 RepID=A0ABM7YL93_9BURK|nr:hypothetical protein CATMQ487_21070 [Sphaerotilus sp. FB-5]
MAKRKAPKVSQTVGSEKPANAQAIDSAGSSCTAPVAVRKDSAIKPIAPPGNPVTTKAVIAAANTAK